MIEKSIELINSNEPPIRGLGVHMLTANLRESSYFVPIECKEKAFCILIQLLNDAESFVYLASVHAIAHMISRDKPLFLHKIINILSDTSIERPVRQRVLITEILVLVTRRAGPSAAGFSRLIFNTCMKLIRFRPGAIEEHLLNIDKVDLLKLRSTLQEQADSSNTSNDQHLGYHAADLIILRQSAISLLAEISVSAGFTSFEYLFEVIDVACGILTMEAQHSQVTIYARR